MASESVVRMHVVLSHHLQRIGTLQTVLVMRA
jgi:hypothetical protein